MMVAKVTHEMWDYINYSVLVRMLLPRPPEEVVRVMALAHIKLIASTLDDDLQSKIDAALGDALTDAIRAVPDLPDRIRELSDRLSPA